MIRNPILPGFNPDPSIVRVGEDYYIATSTFEWFPGVQIHHSRDLVNWELVARPLNRTAQLDMLGVPDSGGVWAPCLSYDNGIFYLVYSNVKSFQGVWKDTPNYLVTTEDILGEWSDPVFLGSSGFDGSLFHDADGRKYYLSMLVDHRQGVLFGGITLQEYAPEEQRLIGPVHYLLRGTGLGCTEAPHLYRRKGYYYLLLAEGGTEYNHAVTVARSRELAGPYEIHPENPIMTASHAPAATFQKTGHADLVETPDGAWYIVALCGRPLTQRGRCTLGRETIIEEVVWREDWPYLKNGDKLVREQVPGLHQATLNDAPKVWRDDFTSKALDLYWQSLRVPVTEEWCSLRERPGWLRLTGRESLSSLHRQSLLARRVQHFHFEASTTLDFHPDTFQQMAGLVCYYNTYHWHYLHVMGDESGQRMLQVTTCDKYVIREAYEEPIVLPEVGAIQLRVVWNRANIQFFYAEGEGPWRAAGPPLDGSILSDDYVTDAENRYRPAFTGAFVGVCCQDLSGRKKTADFAEFEYRPLKVAKPAG
jgi:xylan 1,4-beta-xylosidase